MAGTVLNFDPTLITQNYGWFWVGMAIPGAGARATLHTDGTPESVANPNAKHLGHTVEGWEMRAVPQVTGYSVDEAVAEIKRTTTALEATIGAALVQTADLTGVMQHLVQGFGTYGAGAGYQQITLGLINVIYTSVALIWPLEADPTKFGVYHLYKAQNDAGIANQIKRRDLANNPVAFRGLAVTSRAATDQLGNYWKQL